MIERDSITYLLIIDAVLLFVCTELTDMGFTTPDVRGQLRDISTV